MNKQDNKLSFVQVTGEPELIESIFLILKLSGEDMYTNQGLEHWRTPYSTESIKKDCKDKSVFLVQQESSAIATFQLMPDDKGLLLSKFSVLPSYAGQGIGKKCLDYIFEKCTTEKTKVLHLSVFDKSEKAIRFYLNNGFEITGASLTRRFRVLLMEKHFV